MGYSWRRHSALSRTIRESPCLLGRQEIPAGRGPNVPEVDGVACGIVLPLVRGTVCDTPQSVRTRRRATACPVLLFLDGNARTPRRARRTCCLPANHNC